MDPAYDLVAYAQGPYMRVEDEREDEDLPIVGALPPELRGMFVQNASNPRFDPLSLPHWFDGDGMVHGVELRDGKATYRNRYIRTAAWQAEDAAGHALTPGLLGPLDLSRAEADKDTANTDLVWFRDRLLATWWLSGQPYRIAVPGLETVGPERFDGTLDVPMCAHPKVDPRTGELVFLDFDAYGRHPLRHGIIGADGRLRELREVEGARATLYHDLAITERFTVVPDLPLRYDPERLARGKRRPRFDADQPARFGLVPRDGGPVRWFEASSCFSYHMINAWEEVRADRTIVHLLGCRITEPLPTRPREEEADIPRLFFLRLEPTLYRWSFDLATGRTSEAQLDDVLTEFPRMDDRCLGASARYAFSPHIWRGPTLAFDGIIKYDLHSGGSETLRWGEGRLGAEVVFAPRGEGSDDGWLLTFVTDLEGRASELVVVDAQDVQAGPVARVQMARRVPLAFHAEWVPGSAI
jgi:carotenoid cleavage dioxygenase-like enzyme